MHPRFILAWTLLAGIPFHSRDSLAVDGEAVFKSQCLRCHKEGNRFPKAASLRNIQTSDAATIRRILLRGETYKGKEHQKDLRGKISEEEMASVSAWIAERAGR